MSEPRTFWSPTFVLLAVANISCALIFYLLAPSTATLAAQQFGASTSQAGVATGLFFLGGVLARLVSGPIAGAAGLRRTLLAAQVFFALASAGYLFVGSLGQLMALRLVNGIGFGIASTALASAALGTAPVQRRAEATGWFTSGTALATGLGPLIALNLLRIPDGTRLLLLIVAATGLLGLVMVLITIGKVPGLTPGVRPRARLVEPRVFPIAGIGLLAAISFSVVLTYLADFSTEAGLQDAAAFFFLVYAATMLVLRPFMGRLQDARGATIVVVPALTAMVAGMGLIASATTGPVLLIGASLLGFGYGTLLSSGQAMSLNMVDAASSTLAIASFFLLVDLGTGLGPTLLGAVVPLVGFRGAFAIGGALAAVGLVAFLLFVRTRPARG